MQNSRTVRFSASGLLKSRLTRRNVRRVPNCHLINQSPIYSLNGTRLGQTKTPYTLHYQRGRLHRVKAPPRHRATVRYAAFPMGSKAEKTLCEMSAARSVCGVGWQPATAPGAMVAPGYIPERYARQSSPARTVHDMLFALGGVDPPGAYCRTFSGLAATTHSPSSSEIERRIACPMLNCRLQCIVASRMPIPTVRGCRICPTDVLGLMGRQQQFRRPAHAIGRDEGRWLCEVCYTPEAELVTQPKTEHRGEHG